MASTSPRRPRYSPTAQAVTDYDADHSRDGEDRWTTIGLAGGLLILVRVTWTDRDGDDEMRIISARPADPRDRTIYLQG